MTGDPPPAPEWLQPARLLPDLALTLFVLLVAARYLGAHLLDALALWAAA